MTKKNIKIKSLWRCMAIVAIIFTCACVSNVAQETTVSDDKTKSGVLTGIEEKERARIAEIKAAAQKEDPVLTKVIKGTINYTVTEYLDQNPNSNNPASHDFTVGGYDVMDIVIYEEPNLTRQNIQVSADGFISFPLLGRLQVEGLSTSQIEKLISNKLAEGKIMLDAHVSVAVREVRSKKYIMLGCVKTPGTYPLQSRERILDAISKAGGIDFDQGGKQMMIIRTEKPNTEREKKVVIRVELNSLLKGDQVSNIMLVDKDVVYIPRAENFHIMGQVKNPGSFPYVDKEITLVEAISKAGGFTSIAAPNRTRIIRVEDGVEKIIEIKVDEITGAGKKGQDVKILPGDVIYVPESYF